MPYNSLRKEKGVEEWMTAIKKYVLYCDQCDYFEVGTDVKVKKVFSVGDKTHLCLDCLNKREKRS